MKIDYAIHSSDSNPYYLDFWPIISEIWKKKFDVIPILVFIGDKNIELDERFGIVIKLSPIEGIAIHLQAQIVRFWITTTYPNDVSIISDIDMIPLSHHYFVKNIANLNNNDYLHINPCIGSYGRLPACYHIAKGSTFKEVLSIDEQWDLFIRKVLSDKDNLNGFGHDKMAWFADELYTSKKVLTYNGGIKINLIERERGQNGYRIDRALWLYSKMLLKYDYYFDSHSIRPYSQHKAEINSIKNTTLIANKNFPPKYLQIFVEYYFNLRYMLSKIKHNITNI